MIARRAAGETAHDERDWAAIGRWARELSGLLTGAPSPASTAAVGMVGRPD